MPDLPTHVLYPLTCADTLLPATGVDAIYQGSTGVLASVTLNAATTPEQKTAITNNMKANYMQKSSDISQYGNILSFEASEGMSS